MSNGEVDCWGKSYLPRTESSVPAPVPGISGADAVGANFRYNCALLEDGSIECWGDNGYGQLGNGSKRDSATPVKVRGISDALEVSTGGFHACALLATHEVDCWGRNLQGSLGDGTLNNSSLPVRVIGITNALAISAGYGHDETCAVLSRGLVMCWGANNFGKLGKGTFLT